MLELVSKLHNCLHCPRKVTLGLTTLDLVPQLVARPYRSCHQHGHTGSSSLFVMIFVGADIAGIEIHDSSSTNIVVQTLELSCSKID